MDKTIQSLGEFIAYIQECKNKDYPSIATDERSDKILYRGHANVFQNYFENKNGMKMRK